jgi:choice-of-anchor A domain-containing protein
LRHGGATRELTLWNFYEATSLTIEGIGVQGTVLTPFADITFNTGNVEGTLIGASLFWIWRGAQLPL